MGGAISSWAFDECIPYPCEIRVFARNPWEMTHRLVKRCITACDGDFGKIMGYNDFVFRLSRIRNKGRILRFSMLEFIASCGTRRNAIGGLSVSEGPAEINDV